MTTRGGLVGITLLGLMGMVAAARATPAPAPAPAPSPAPATAPVMGPDIVVLDELVRLYEPVPFDHRTHAEMAQMWDGCVTCHHRQPEPATQPAPPNGATLSHAQSEASQIPACKSCHPANVEEADLHMPGLKGAYHRQCLNCHRDWAGENACVICHAPLNGHVSPATAPSRDDIVGRMHPPIPEPKEKHYITRFTPVAGRNVLFRHEEHVRRFGMGCALCHHRDNCADCHARGAATASETARPRPLRPGRTWRDTHGPCVGCHVNDACAHCHYADADSPPAPFAHGSVGQELDRDHAGLACNQCHNWLKGPVGCGDSSCHPRRAVSFPADRPGPLVLTAAPPAEPAPAATQPSTQPATRPTIVRIRRGGS